MIREFGGRHWRGDRPLRICFVALGAYPLFDPAVRGSMGGMETRAWIFARQLAQRNAIEVSFVVHDHGQAPVREIDRIRVFAWREPLARRVVRLAHGIRSGAALPAADGAAPQGGLPTRLWTFSKRASSAARRYVGQVFRGIPAGPALYARIPADVFLSFGVNDVSAEAVSECRKNHRKCILCVAHDSDLHEAFVTPTNNRREDGVRGIEGHLTLTQADEIVVQSRHQLELLQARFGRTGRLICNPIDMTADDSAGRSLEPDVAEIVARGPYVLWVGRSDPVYKRPDLCFELAQKLPLVRFVMVMAHMDASCHADLKRRRPANVDLIDGLPFHDMPHLFRSALLLVSTSAQEGFPNTFLQAGKYGIPIVSLNVDPAGMLSVHGAGIVCGGDLQKMAGAVQRLAADADGRGQYTARLVEYVSAIHGLERRCDELCDVIVETMHGPDERRPGRGSAPGGVHHESSGRTTATVIPNDHAHKYVA